ncbi:hypothetical protein UFOVP1025_20 [uncultured Caudovirales phage]|uniref:Uncharacterized protein n=1 Tax=uncultured Caudovirales phage TaxID=2100421 RepID=A0A6J5P3R9_9CAUD|nr:hypothetical protein UFOVP852_14 [uncultured Caudovirales phage]CAB4173212.1 hypothetical protein UFOVP948_37 [uncultured Caudovirales phage]CAB4178967.1 hypothetical protein UFOVP1025_20 [uncultured Caudovirales phage]CAB4219901.1 hypothetical protein UFOVP1628_23 [uncultured Caudovirales phage]
MIAVNAGTAIYQLSAIQFIKGYKMKSLIPEPFSKEFDAMLENAPEMLRLLIDIEAHLSGRAALHSGSLIFAEDRPALAVISSTIDRARGNP